MTYGDEHNLMLRVRLETLQSRLESVRAGRRVLMELLACQLEEKRRLTRRLQDAEKRLRRSNLRCLRMEAERGYSKDQVVISFPERR
ncbi:MAG: hypothetical protein AB1445_00730 [Bacillota bacterium]